MGQTPPIGNVPRRNRDPRLDSKVNYMGHKSSSLSTPGPWVFGLLKPLLFALLLASCGSNRYYDPSKPHHTPDGFRNNYPHAERKISFAWRWEQFWQNRPLASATDPRPETLDLDEDFLRTNQAERALTWIGHSTVLLQLSGVNVLIDPFFSKRASPLSFAGLTRKVPPALRLDRLPHIDVVLISHDHYDHLDLPTAKALYGQPGGPPRFIVPLGLTGVPSRSPTNPLKNHRGLWRTPWPPPVYRLSSFL